MTEELALSRRDGLPDDLRFLLARWPRTAWDSALGETGRFWLARHAMFREVHGLLVAETTAFADRVASPERFGRRFERLAGFFLGELETHHHVEDDHYFPRLAALEPRLARGFALLDADHHALHGALEQAGADASALMRALRGPDAGGAAARMAQTTTALGLLLDRHLADEEDIVAPLLIDRGEAGL